MIALYIILGIALLFAALLMLRVRFDIAYSDDVTLTLRILFLKFKLYPGKTKIKKQKKKTKKGKTKTTEKRTVKKKASIADVLDKILTVLKMFHLKMKKHLRIDVSRIIITVGGEDAAAAAINFGVVSQLTAYTYEFLRQNFNIKTNSKSEIAARVNFISEKTEFDIAVSASITLWQLLDIALSVAYNYYAGNQKRK